MIIFDVYFSFTSFLPTPIPPSNRATVESLSAGVTSEHFVNVKTDVRVIFLQLFLPRRVTARYAPLAEIGKIQLNNKYYTLSNKYKQLFT